MNPDLAPKFFQIWESDSRSNSGNVDATEIHQCLYLSNNIYKDHADSCYCRKKSDSGTGFSQILDSGSWSDKKRRILPESTPDPWPPLTSTRIVSTEMPQSCETTLSFCYRLLRNRSSLCCVTGRFNHVQHREMLTGQLQTPCRPIRLLLQSLWWMFVPRKRISKWRDRAWQRWLRKMHLPSMLQNISLLLVNVSVFASAWRRGYMQRRN